jgi:asparagine synthase (glutamine-hydrolysing)
VPIATFLSGGIDSALVTAYAREESSAPITAFSIGFVEKAFDESPFARETAERIGVPIRVDIFSDDKARERLADALLAYDEPFGDSSSLATYLLCRHVSREFKVALGGDGGDEVFAGYSKYMVARLRRPFAAVPRLRDALGHAIDRVPIRRDSSARWMPLVRKLHRAGTVLEGPDGRVYTRFTQWGSLVRTGPLMRRTASADWFEGAAQRRFEAAVGTQLQKSLTADLGSMLCNDMLVKVDRASMACSLEARVPFLDHRVAEFGVGLPELFTLGGGPRVFTGKRVLRELHERRFGRTLARRKKQGFAVPIQQWLTGPLAPACDRLFEAARLDRFGILSSEMLSQRGYRRWLAGADSWLVWHAFALAAWCEAVLGDGPDALRELLHTQPNRSAAPMISPTLRKLGAVS